MKQAKIMLSAAAVVILVSGAFAFKAKRGNATLYTTSAGTICDQPAVLNVDPNGLSSSSPSATFDQGATCTTVSYSVE